MSPPRSASPSSSSSPERALRKAIEGKAFEGAYCLYGEDDFRKEKATRELVAAAVEAATRDFNLDVRQGAELDAETLGSLLSTPPMMAERRVVVVRDAAGLKKEAKGWLDAYLERAAAREGAADVVLLLVYTSGEKGKPDKNVLARSLAVDFAPLSWERLPKWIAHHASAELGVTVTESAAELLQQAVGNDLAALAAELDKLASYTRGAEIDESAVAEVVGVRRGETLADFLDLVARRDASRALALVPHILTQPKVNGVTVVMALTTQTFALAWGEAALARGLSQSRLQGEYFNFLKSGGGAYTGRPWGDAVRAWASAVGEWDATSLDAAFEALLAADIALKDTRVSSDEQTLSNVVLALCAGGASGSGRGGARGGARRAGSRSAA